MSGYGRITPWLPNSSSERINGEPGHGKLALVVGLTIMSSETRLVSVSASALPFPWSIQCILESFS